MEQEQTITKTPEQTITKTPPPHIKNPKRVAQGKKLAAISREAKQRKKERMKTIQEEDETSTTSLITTTGAILGTCCTLLLTFIAYSQWSKQKEVEIPKIPKISKTPVVYKDLSQYDL